MSTETITTGETYTLIINGNEEMNITANGGIATSGNRRGNMGFPGDFGRRQ